MQSLLATSAPRPFLGSPLASTWFAGRQLAAYIVLKAGRSRWTSLHLSRNAQSCLASTSTAQEKTPPQDAGPREAMPGMPRHTTEKRMVAMHVAYVGTGYRGLQRHQEHPGGTIEDDVEAALFSAGCILASNRGFGGRLKWSRSSRTDKGVHSLATVLAMKLECPPGAFDKDPHGSGLAAAINQHLPPQIRVLSVQRVNGSFNARGMCHDRTYYYYLPASCVGVPDSPSEWSEEDRARAHRLEAAWRAFEGNHAFHNYTRRALYRSPRSQKKIAESKRKGRSRDSIDEELEMSSSDSEQDYGDELGITSSSSLSGAPSSSSNNPEEGAASPAPAAAAAVAPATHDQQQQQWRQQQQQQQWQQKDGVAGGAVTAAGGQPNREDASGAVGAAQREAGEGGAQPSREDASVAGRDASEREEGEGGAQQPLRVLIKDARWNEGVDELDPVGQSHYRTVLRCEVQQPGEGPRGCFRLSVTGSSFMLHQIRHMVGAAVSVARGLISLDFVEASLCAPSRTSVPLAPPHTLVLADNTFHDFPVMGNGECQVAAYSGARLSLPPPGQAELAAFSQSMLYPALEKLSQHDDWVGWRRRLAAVQYIPEEVDAVVAAMRNFRVDQAARKEERAARAVGFEGQQDRRWQRHGGKQRHGNNQRQGGEQQRASD